MRQSYARKLKKQKKFSGFYGKLENPSIFTKFLETKHPRQMSFGDDVDSLKREQLSSMFGVLNHLGISSNIHFHTTVQRLNSSCIFYGNRL